MQEQIFELSVGDVLHIGDTVLTVIDIDGPEVSFRMDEEGGHEIAAMETADALPRK